MASNNLAIEVYCMEKNTGIKCELDRSSGTTRWETDVHMRDKIELRVNEHQIATKPAIPEWNGPQKRK
ncbi:hypothetical protein EYC84_009209 [Monilinia fructicola]|uniref:Uncharacterized protein n=1 Tax=Monilinia fructicola TaxID=38448 RepID=A0A5M9JE87_MONFR|nr:hypothetical protein EYC84_009209 [Monilinia fructicola]